MNEKESPLILLNEKKETLCLISSKIRKQVLNFEASGLTPKIRIWRYLPIIFHWNYFNAFALNNISNNCEYLWKWQRTQKDKATFSGPWKQASGKAKWIIDDVITAFNSNRRRPKPSFFVSALILESALPYHSIRITESIFTVRTFSYSKVQFNKF